MIEVWDGKSETRPEHRYAAPDAADWNRIIQEMSKTQQVVIENNNVYSNTANEDILIGQPLILESDIELAGNNPEVVGLSIVNCIIGEDCIYITQGRLSLSDWTNIIGEMKLIPGRCYFLSMQEIGKLTSVAPSSRGDTVVQVGRAQSTETLSISIEVPMYLT